MYVFTKRSTCYGRSRQFPFQIIGTPSRASKHFADYMDTYNMYHPDIFQIIRSLFRSSGHLNSSTPKGQVLVAKMKYLVPTGIKGATV